MIADAALVIAIGGLLAVLGGRILLLSSVSPTFQAHTLISASGISPGEAVHLVLVVDRDAAHVASRADAQVRGIHPDRRLEVVRARWPVSWRDRSREARVARLVRTYGYSDLPVLLTVSREGQVVRVQPFPLTPGP